MSLCPHCNTQLLDNATFCHICGKSVENKAPVSAKEFTNFYKTDPYGSVFSFSIKKRGFLTKYTINLDILAKK